MLPPMLSTGTAIEANPRSPQSKLPKLLSTTTASRPTGGSSAGRLSSVSWHCNRKELSSTGICCRFWLQRSARPGSTSAPAHSRLDKAPREWPNNTSRGGLPWGPNPRRPSRTALCSACKSCKRAGKVSSPGRVWRPSNKPRTAVSSLPGCCTANTGHPWAANSLASHSIWAVEPPRPWLNSSHRLAGAPPAGHHRSSAKGASRCSTAKLRC